MRFHLNLVMISTECFISCQTGHYSNAPNIYKCKAYYRLIFSTLLTNHVSLSMKSYKRLGNVHHNHTSKYLQYLDNTIYVRKTTCCCIPRSYISVFSSISSDSSKSNNCSHRQHSHAFYQAKGSFISVPPGFRERCLVFLTYHLYGLELQLYLNYSKLACITPQHFQQSVQCCTRSHTSHVRQQLLQTTTQSNFTV